MGPFGWLRVDARISWPCSRCKVISSADLPVLVDWMDRTSTRDQRQIADGLRCPRCDALEPVDVPLMQYRRGDVVGLVVGLPARSATTDDEAVIRDVLAVACSAGSLEGADIVAAVRMAWWGSVWNRPLGPRLVGSLPLVLPESDDETQRWRVATVDALELPDVGAALRQFVGSSDTSVALETVREHPVLISPRWRLTVETMLSQLREIQHEPEAAQAIDARGSLLRQARLIGLEAVAGLPADDRLNALVEMATSTADADEQLVALRTLLKASEGAEPSALAVAAHLAYVSALHGDRRRRPQDDEQMIAAARRTVELATETLGADHQMTQSSLLNLAVCVEERSDVQHEDALAEAQALLEDLAPRAARSGSPIIADVATNLATLAARRPGSRADNPDDAAALLEDSRHVRSLTFHDERRDVLVALVDEAATLRSKVSGSLRENAFRAVELLRDALAKDAEWQILSASERVLSRSNLSNALSQLHGRSPHDASAEEVSRAARESAEAAGELDEHNAVAMQAYTNAGAVLVDLYANTLMAGQPDATLWTDARDALERAFETTNAAYPPHHPNVLRAAVNLASVHGSSRDGHVADADRCAQLLGYVLEHAPEHQADFRRAAATNLAQLRIGQGSWDTAAAAYETAAAAQRLLFAQARTYATRLGEVLASSDLAARRALALVGAGRHREAVRVLEENRTRLARGGRADGDEPAPSGSPLKDPGSQRAIVHLATCDYGTLGVIELPSGIVDGFWTALSSGCLKPLVRELLGAPDRESRRERLDALIADLSSGVVEPLTAFLRASDESVDELALIACGTLAACPLRCVPDASGRTLTRWFALRELVSAATTRQPVIPSPQRAVAVVDPDGSLPFARAEREALSGWATTVLQAPPDWPTHRWLLAALPDATVAHLACHGRLDPDDPMRSRFEVGTDSHLTVDDLTELSTSGLDLVVAPACQSASASPDAPDELLGVAHALTHAGARVVIASEWDADDAATALVVARLYEEMGSGAPPAQALARAQRWVAEVTVPQLARLSADRLSGLNGARWLPYDLAIEFSALTVHPRYRSTSVALFAHPADWASLSCLEA